MNVSIEITADGSPTFYRNDIDEHYHSVKGALAESLHVYVRSGWQEAARRSSGVRVFEVGFGTGLNAVLTAGAALESAVATEYFSAELYPLPEQSAALFGEALPEEYRRILHDVNAAPWDETSRINPYFTLSKLHDNLLSMKLPERIDVVYFDAFAPEKQPEMWHSSIFQKIFQSMNPGGVLTTYCAKGAIRRMLGEIGFQVERLPGPPGGKREILRAVRPDHT